MFGLGKNRSKLGKWLDKRGISQQWLVKKSGVGRNTVGDLVSGKNDRSPTTKTIQKIMKALRTIDKNVKADDFFDM